MNKIKKLLIIVSLIILILFSISINDGNNMNSKQPLKEIPIECTATPALEEMLVMEPEDEIIAYEEVAEVVAEDQPEMFSAPQTQY